MKEARGGDYEKRGTAAQKKEDTLILWKTSVQKRRHREESNCGQGQ
jgi:hypothetical protein